MLSRWSPSDRLALVERLQALTGSVSESFFDAHGLGTAYRLPGDKSSKRARINSALHAAEVRGDVDDLLDAVLVLLDGGMTAVASTRSKTTSVDRHGADSVGFGSAADARAARGVVIGGGNVQVNNFYGGTDASLGSQGRSRGAWLDELNSVADRVLDLDALQPSQRVDGSAEWIRDVGAARREEILGACEDLVRVVVAAVRSGKSSVAKLWVDLVPTLAPNPHRGGITQLLNLFRAPGVVVFQAGGMVSCAVREDELTGLLLGSGVQVDDPFLGSCAAFAVLQADLVYPGGWPSQQLREYLVPLLAEALGERRAGDAWERWTYLLSVATTELRGRLRGVSLSRPYLRVADRSRGSQAVVVGPGILREVVAAGDSSPLLRGGLCDGRPDAFERAARDFEQDYGPWADSMDWRALPGGGGALPTGPHYPGERRT